VLAARGGVGLSRSGPGIGTISAGTLPSTVFGSGGRRSTFAGGGWGERVRPRRAVFFTERTEPPQPEPQIADHFVPSGQWELAADSVDRRAILALAQISVRFKSRKSIGSGKINVCPAVYLAFGELGDLTF
jgi:hypothetical protein